MAAWHFDLDIGGERAELSAPIGTTVFVELLELSAFVRHERYGDTRHSWSDQGHQLTFVDGADIQSLTVRVDLRCAQEDWTDFVTQVCDLIRPHRLRFFAEGGEIIPPEVGAVINACLRAPAIAAIEWLNCNARGAAIH